MSYVQPNSTIQLMHINGLDNRYMHTLYFASETAQNTFMTSKVGATLERNSYQRADRGYLRIKKPYDEIYNYNYLRFQNTLSNTETGQARSNKWYYAFITSCEYLNEGVTEISYQIDDMQTWFIGATCNPCMVEREHSSTDAWGENLEDEPVGSEVYDNDLIYTDPHIDTSYSLVVTTSGMNQTIITDPSQYVAPSDYAGYTDGLFNGAWTTAMNLQGNTPSDIRTAAVAMCRDLWETIKGDWNTSETPIQVLNMKMFPTDYTSGGTSGWDVPVNPQPQHYTHEFARPTQFDQYVPQNKKMLTYPFSFLTGTTGDGDAQQLKWEYFDGGYGTNVRIDSYGCSVGSGEIIYVPQDYNGEPENYDCKMVINNFPMCPFTYDAYQAWLAAGGDVKIKTERNYALASSIVNGVSMLPNAVGEDTTLGGVTSLANVGISMAKSVTKANYEFKNAAYKPRVVVGSSSTSAMTGHALLTTKYYHTHIRDDEAMRVDEFLTMFGYATNRVKTPNFTGRRYWNFVKTNGSSLRGNIPAQAMANICAILDGGINFWHGDYVGNYNIGHNGTVITNPIG